MFVFWHFVSLGPHQGRAWQTSSVNLGFLSSVSLSAARFGGGRWALAENDPSGLIVFWPADWRWEEKQRHGERKRGGWVLMHSRQLGKLTWLWELSTQTHTKGTLSKVQPSPQHYKKRETWTGTAQWGTCIHTSWCQHIHQCQRLFLQELIRSTKHTNRHLHHGSFPPPFSPVINLHVLTLSPSLFPEKFKQKRQPSLKITAAH